MGTHHYEPSDLTARARIRDAALEQFAEKGIEGATMRGIASAAGVSLGLVQHHFGTKAGLRVACDELVIEVFNRRVLHLHEKGQLADANALGDLFAEGPLLMRYLSRAALEGSQTADEVFDHLAAGTREFLTSAWPERFPPGSDSADDAATMMTAMHMSTALLIEWISRRFGLTPEESLRSGRIPMAMLDVYSAMGEFADSDTGRGIRETVRTIRTAAPEEGT
ncbi:TetR/AcrR family transcriptional regulator [Egibacter rhizosphaerae]|uniref:TetR/AcrR family transcriptional regulator n=1 Tax=Egibacter rhizosphaerae TaxID=1670831 RepID=A0A411YCA7_9ACTN|nr:TetR/AcrR family transcriptional regulator [Egibacter rhizosphaerae]QBI18816.1 TetR/AcrR family transcriptional regulator [Egibacter rhizosphaerae]